MTSCPAIGTLGGMQERKQGFGGARVLALESRRAREMAQLISNNGGLPVVAPTTQEVALGANAEVVNFTRELLEGRFQCILFLTGVGTRILAQEAEAVCSRQEFVSALSRIAVVARGPKPIAALRELGVPVTLAVPEPNTWREILKALDDSAVLVPLKGRTIAVQEYGASNPELLQGLAERGAEAVAVRVYQWALPEDLGPIEAAVRMLIGHEVKVILFTSSVQLTHLLEIAQRMKLRGEVIASLQQAVVGSIGPVTSEMLRRQGVQVTVEPSHPKMGFLVKETAERYSEWLNRTPSAETSL
jgi:uroporphyrinogen-III synthase